MSRVLSVSVALGCVALFGWLGMMIAIMASHFSATIMFAGIAAIASIIAGVLALISIITEI